MPKGYYWPGRVPPLSTMSPETLEEYKKWCAALEADYKEREEAKEAAKAAAILRWEQKRKDKAVNRAAARDRKEALKQEARAYDAARALEAARALAAAIALDADYVFDAETTLFGDIFCGSS
jgi:hypothetical protein